MKNLSKLAKILQYILGRRPDEFGLLPDDQGYVRVKELIKVLHEEKWHQVRPGHLETLPLHVPQAGIEMDHNRIRVCARERLPALSEAPVVPKQLFAGIRRKAYEITLREGLRPQTHPASVLLFTDHELAMRVARRRDAEPVIVTVQTTVAQRAGIDFMRFGETIYLAALIPANCCRLPKRPKRAAVSRPAKDTHPPLPPPTPGSYSVDWDRLEKNAVPTKRSPRKSKDWRRERQRRRRMKQSSG
jgi:putative RNA 2'-phosphotransferase